MQVDVARSGQSRAARIEALEGRFELLVDRVVLPHRVDLAEVGIRRQPWRIVVSYPDGDRRPVVQHLDHLALLLASGLLEKPSVAGRCVVDVRAGQWQVLDHEHAHGIRAPVEVVG